MPTRLRSSCNRTFCIAKSAVMHPTGMISFFLLLAEPSSDGVRPSARALCRETLSGVIHSPSSSSSPPGSSYNGEGWEDGASTWGDSESSADGSASAGVFGCSWVSCSSRGMRSTFRCSRPCSIDSRPSSAVSVSPWGPRSPSITLSSAFSGSWEVSLFVTFCVGELESAAPLDEMG